jgi:predicted nucleic acid-binding protein
MAALLDAGALVAIDKGNRRVGAMLRVLQQSAVPVRTSAGVVAEVWRDPRRQANLARVLAGLETIPLDLRDARRSGDLMKVSRTSGVVDAHVALLAEPQDLVLTSDPQDIGQLLSARGIEARVVTV